MRIVWIPHPCPLPEGDGTEGIGGLGSLGGRQAREFAGEVEVDGGVDWVS